MNATDNMHLPRWAYILLALLAAVIGLASSVVTTQFFIIGLNRTEPDALARDALIAAGVLMIVTELAAFGLAAMLPKAQLRALRWRLMACGLALLAFEAATIYVTQVTLVKSSESVAGATSTRMANLQASIDSRRAAAAGLLANGVKQSGSIHGFNRSAGASALSQSIAADKQTGAMADELAALQAGKSPTLTDVLGESWMLVYAVARALLISMMGLVMFGAAGALLRAARGVSAGAAAAPGAVAPAPKLANYTQPTIAPKGVPTGVSYRKAAMMAGVPLAAMTAPMAHAAPKAPPASAAGVADSIHPAGALQDADVSKPIHPVDKAGVAKPIHSAPKKPRAKSRVVKHGTKIDTGVEGRAATRYNRIKAAVKSGSLKPSVRAVQKLEGGSQDVVTAYLKQLESDGVIVRKGRGYAVVKKGGAA